MNLQELELQAIDDAHAALMRTLFDAFWSNSLDGNFEDAVEKLRRGLAHGRRCRLGMRVTVEAKE